MIFSTLKEPYLFISNGKCSSRQRNGNKFASFLLIDTKSIGLGVSELLEDIESSVDCRMNLPSPSEQRVDATFGSRI